MTIEDLITEAKKITPNNYHVAHAWLQDMIITHEKLPDPLTAIRFFMLGLFASDAISLNSWQDFDTLVSTKNPTKIH